MFGWEISFWKSFWKSTEEKKYSKNSSWSKVWMHIAEIIATRSKDPNTRVGCVLVSPDNRQIHIGYNGFAAGIPEPEERWKRPTKYEYVIHAEENAIINARCNLSGWTCYVTLKPCEKCASKLVQSGIKRVIYLDDNTKSANYKLSESILKEGGIELISYEDMNDNNN